MTKHYLLLNKYKIFLYFQKNYNQPNIVLGQNLKDHEYAIYWSILVTC